MRASESAPHLRGRLLVLSVGNELHALSSSEVQRIEQSFTSSYEERRDPTDPSSRTLDDAVQIQQAFALESQKLVGPLQAG